MKKKIMCLGIVFMFFLSSLIASSKSIVIEKDFENDDIVEIDRNGENENFKFSEKLMFSKNSINNQNLEDFKIRTEEVNDKFFQGSHSGDNIYYIVKVECEDKIDIDYVEFDILTDSNPEVYGGFLYSWIIKDNVDLSRPLFDYGSMDVFGWNLRFFETLPFESPMYFVFIAGGKEGCKFTFEIKTYNSCNFSFVSGNEGVIKTKSDFNIKSNIKLDISKIFRYDSLFSKLKSLFKNFLTQSSSDPINIEIENCLIGWFGPNVNSCNPTYKYKTEHAYTSPSGNKKTRITEKKYFVFREILSEGGGLSLFSFETGNWVFQADIEYVKGCDLEIPLIFADVNFP
jgi:hypothetical protein